MPDHCIVAKYSSPSDRLAGNLFIKQARESSLVPAGFQARLSSLVIEQVYWQAAQDIMLLILKKDSI